jgi:putative tricarboxylic transport membrane protein
MALVDRLTGLLLVVLAAAYYRLAGEIEVGLASDLLGPQYFPRLLAVALAIAGAWLFVRSFLPGAGLSQPARAESERLANLWITLGLTVVYLLLLQRVGFLVLTPLLLGAFTWVLGYRRWLPLAATAVAVSVMLWVVFARLLGVRLPPGLLDT